MQLADLNKKKTISNAIFCLFLLSAIPDTISAGLISIHVTTWRTQENLEQTQLFVGLDMTIRLVFLTRSQR